MKWKQWKEWMGQQPWVLRWFILLVLLRPVIDNFYFLKEISPLLSPLYIVGVLTPALCLIAVVKYRVSPRSRLDQFFGYWSVMILLACFILFLFEPFSLLAIEFVLKLSLPVYVYYFLRRFIRSEHDLEGLLQTVLYAGVIVAGLLIYELATGPIRLEESRGMARIQGNFGDVVSYGIYIALTSIAAGYFYFRDKLHRKVSRKSVVTVVLVGIMSAIALFNMHHVASYVVFVAIIGLFLMYNFKVNKGAGIVSLLVIGLVVIYFGQLVLEDSIAPLIETDLEVYAGEQDTERLLHGRVGRWLYMLNLMSEQNIMVQAFGYPLTFQYVYQFIGIGAHNDFIRLLFFTGGIGLFIYILLLYQVFKRSQSLTEYQRFMMFALLITALLYSISTTPTMYAPFVYVLMSGFAFTAIPERRKSIDE